MVWADENSISDGCVIMTGDNVVENQSTRKGTVKINVSQRVKDQLLEIQDDEEHTSMDSVIRSLLEHRAQLTASEWAKSLRRDGYSIHLSTQQEAPSYDRT